MTNMERKCVCGHDILTHKKQGDKRCYCLELCKCMAFRPANPLIHKIGRVSPSEEKKP